MLAECRSLDLRLIPPLPGLRSLGMVDTSITSVHGIERFDSLETLEILHAPRLTSIDGLAALRRLRRLELAGCKRLDTLQPVFALTELGFLNASEIGGRPSLRGIERLERLEEIDFAATVVGDGDLSPLLRLARLARVSFDDRPHYSHTRAEILRSLPSAKTE